MNALAIIPARGGSTDVPDKNILPLAGQPVLFWSFDAAAESSYVGEIILTSDSQDIRESCHNYKKKGIALRVEPPAPDYSNLDTVIIDTLKWFESTRGYLPDLTVLLQPTSPYRPMGIVDRCIEALDSGGFDSVFTACRTKALLWGYESDGKVTGVNHSPTVRCPRQKRIVKYYQENGAVFVTRTEQFIQHGYRLCGIVGMVEVAPEYVFEIDMQLDYKILQTLMEGPHDI